jgi:predicted PurR-regulated permease PerM
MADNAVSRLYPVAVFLVFALGIGALALRILAPFGAAFAWAIVLVVGFSGPWRWLEARMPRRRTSAALLFSTVVALLVLLPAVSLAGVLVNEAVGVVSRVSTSLAERNVSGIGDLRRMAPVREALALVERKAGLGEVELMQKGSEVAAGLSGLLARASGGVVKGLFDAVLTFLMTLFLLFFLLRDGDALARGLLDLVPLPEEKRLAVFRSLRGMLQSIFRGSLLCALIQGATGAIGWAIAGLPSPVLAGAAMAVLSLLPVGGTALVWAPGALACWVQGRPGMAVFLAVWGVVVVSTLADNFLKPALIGASGEMSTLVVFLGVFGGIGAFGLLGLFIGPMVLAFGLTLLQILRESTRPEPLAPGTP